VETSLPSQNVVKSRNKMCIGRNYLGDSYVSYVPTNFLRLFDFAVLAILIPERAAVRVAEKVEKAPEISRLKGALSTHRLVDLSIAEAIRKKMKEGSGKVDQKYREICGHEAKQRTNE
jgi:hypothetical protein